jgi:hypothetical protein
MNTVSDQEVWKPVVGYQGRYEVSSLGRVASLIGCAGQERRILKPSLFNKYGHLKVVLHGNIRPYGENKQIHHLVLETFVGPCPTGKKCLHLDEKRANNRLDNLCWGIPKQNKADKIRHGTGNRGEKHARSRLTDKIIIDIWMSPETQREISDRYGISQALVSGIRSRTKWAHVARPEVPKHILEERKLRERRNNRSEGANLIYPGTQLRLLSV